MPGSAWPGRYLWRPVAIGALLLISIPAGVVMAWITAQIVYPLLPPIETRVTATAVSDSRTARVSGTANLPDGAVLAVSVFPADPSATITSDGQATVRDGRFAWTTDVSAFPPGPAEAYLSFGIGWGVDEPLPVVLTYGLYGERLAGDQVWSDSGDRQLETSVPVLPSQ